MRSLRPKSSRDASPDYCGAVWRPEEADGLQLKLLELPADGVLLRGFTTVDIAGMEFIRNALDGLGVSATRWS